MLPDSLRIVDYSIGHTGSIHDSWAFCNTLIYWKHEDIFAPGEWVWADAAYPADTWCIIPFKKPAGGELSLDQKTFNYYLSKVRA